jgi:hypothetical protein
MTPLDWLCVLIPILALVFGALFLCLAPANVSHLRDEQERGNDRPV